VRERVLHSALKCFGAFGFEGTSTRLIAQRAGVTHTLVLYHFQSKDNLWISMMEYMLHDYLSDMHAPADDGTSAADLLANFIERFVRMTASKPEIHHIMTMESNQGTSRLQWVIDKYLREHFKKIVDLIRRGQADGKVRQCDPARLYYLILGAGGTPFTISTEYKELTGRDVFSETEVLRIVAFIYEIVFDCR
jgi:TetR/AcrR family transcriptional regulator